MLEHALTPLGEHPEAATARGRRGVGRIRRRSRRQRGRRARSLLAPAASREGGQADEQGECSAARAEGAAGNPSACSARRASGSEQGGAEPTPRVPAPQSRSGRRGLA
jgi:hypothetical protein